MTGPSEPTLVPGRPEASQRAAIQVHVAKHERPSFALLEELWSSLAGGAVHSPFQSPVFLDAFQRHAELSNCEHLTVLSASQAKGEAPAMLLPVVTCRRGPFRVVTMPDLGLADQNAPVLSRALAGRPEVATDMARALLEAVEGGDILDIPKINALIGGLKNPLFDQRGATDTGWTYNYDGAALASVDMQSGKSVFKEARTKFRKLQGKGVDFVEVNTSAERRALLEHLLLQRSVRFGELGRANSIETDNRDNFYRYLADNTDPDNPFKLFALKTDTEVVAVAALMAHGDIANGVLISIGDASWHRLSPGIVLLVQTLRWARENKISNFSFGTGLQTYKQRFGAGRQPVRRLLRPLSLKGQAFVFASRVKAMMRKGERDPDVAWSMSR